MRDGSDDEKIAAAITRIWQKRDDRYTELRAGGVPVPHKIEMSYIGG